jgi:bacterioferritin
MDKARLITILNDLVSVEIAAVTEYQQHAYLIKDPKIVELLENFSMDEMSHIEWFSREVVRLGGMPTVIPKGIKHASKTHEELIRRDIEVEADAIKRLSEYMKVAEQEGDRRIKRLLRDVRADEETHYETLGGLLNPPKSALARIEKQFMNTGTGLIFIGAFWLYFWLFLWYPFFVADPRWAHNFAYPLILIIIGISYLGKKLSTDMVAAISAFMIIPTESGAISGLHSSYIVLAMLAITILLLALERGRKQELLFLQHRWRRWLKQHSLTFAFLFLMHMAFIYWFMRAIAEPSPVNLPPESFFHPEGWATATFNVLLIPFGLIGMAERFRGTLRRTVISKKLGYWLSLMITIVGIVIIDIASGAWLMFAAPLIAAMAIAIISVIAQLRATSRIHLLKYNEVTAKKAATFVR